MLKKCHGGTVSNHFGLLKTKNQVPRRFFVEMGGRLMWNDFDEGVRNVRVTIEVNWQSKDP